MARTQIEHICQTCQATFTRPLGTNPAPKYCSHKCYSASYHSEGLWKKGRSKSVTLACEPCAFALVRAKRLYSARPLTL
jgi:hypothetical protein